MWGNGPSDSEVPQQTRQWEVTLSGSYRLGGFYSHPTASPSHPTHRDWAGQAGRGTFLWSLEKKGLYLPHEAGVFAPERARRADM